MNAVIGKQKPFGAALNQACFQQGMDIGMHRFHIALHTAGDFTQRQPAGAGHGFQYRPAFCTQHLPEQFIRRKTDARFTALPLFPGL